MRDFNVENFNFNGDNTHFLQITDSLTIADKFLMQNMTFKASSFEKSIFINY